MDSWIIHVKTINLFKSHSKIYTFSWKHPILLFKSPQKSINIIYDFNAKIIKKWFQVILRTPMSYKPYLLKNSSSLPHILIITSKFDRFHWYSVLQAYISAIISQASLISSKILIINSKALLQYSQSSHTCLNLSLKASL